MTLLQLQLQCMYSNSRWGMLCPLHFLLSPRMVIVKSSPPPCKVNDPRNKLLIRVYIQHSDYWNQGHFSYLFFSIVPQQVRTSLFSYVNKGFSNKIWALRYIAYIMDASWNSTTFDFSICSCYFFLRIETHKRNVLGCHIHVHEEMFMIMHLEASCDGQI
jgi:hypothetical protein